MIFGPDRAPVRRSWQPPENRTSNSPSPVHRGSGGRPLSALHNLPQEQDPSDAHILLSGTDLSARIGSAEDRNTSAKGLLMQRSTNLKRRRSLTEVGPPGCGVEARDHGYQCRVHPPPAPHVSTTDQAHRQASVLHGSGGLEAG